MKKFPKPDQSSSSVSYKVKPRSEFTNPQPIKKLCKGDTDNQPIKVQRIYQGEQKGKSKEYFARENLTDVELDEPSMIRESEIVLASKFCRLIARDYFASEHQLDTGQAVSRALPDSVIPYHFDIQLEQKLNPEDYDLEVPVLPQAVKKQKYDLSSLASLSQTHSLSH